MPEQIHGSSILEFTWTVIPILILVALFVPALDPRASTSRRRRAKTTPTSPSRPSATSGGGSSSTRDGIHVQATPPNYDDLDPPHLVVPTDKTSSLNDPLDGRGSQLLRRRTPLYKIQAIPGNVNQMHFKVEDDGEYYGQCYQFCGLRHSDMRFVA